MEIRASDVYRALLRQCIVGLERTEPQSVGKALVDFTDFALSDAAGETAQAVKAALERFEMTRWDESWVVSEMARATLDALAAWRAVADVMLERLKNVPETDATRELRERLLEACGRRQLESWER